jgi:hypothetical protein
VHFSGDDLEGPAVEEEAAIGDAEGWLLGTRGMEREESEEREDYAEERGPEKRG